MRYDSTYDGVRMTAENKMKIEAGESAQSLETMGFDELLSLRERLDTLIAQRISAEERELEQRLARIKRLKLSPGADVEADKTEEPRPRKLPARYRNPEDPSQTWAGRGLQPRWLKQALKSGKKLSYFLVPDPE